MKILQIAPYFIPYPGGQERYVYNLSKYLIRRGHEVHVITSNYPKTKKSEIIDGITVERYNVLARILRNPIMLHLAKIGEKTKDFDIVHIHNEHSFSAMVATYFKIRYSFPLVLTIHGQLKFDDTFSDVFEKIYSQIFGKLIFKTADKIVVLSTSDAEYVSSFGTKTEKISVLPNALDITDFNSYLKSKPGTKNFLNRYNIGKKNIVLFVGQLIPRKGIEYLIKSIKYVIKQVPKNEIVFLIVGSGTISKKIKGIIETLNIDNNVIFTGEIPFSDLVCAYKSADIFVLPSLSEGLPTTILEAMYFSLPVIATDIAGVEDHFRNVALLIPPKDEKSLANAVLKLLDDVRLAKKLAKEGKSLVESKYTWDTVAMEYEGIYERTIEEVK